MIMVVAGVAVLAHVTWCWTGRSRAWARRTAGRQWVLGIGPPFGLLLLGGGLAALLGRPAGTTTGTVLFLAAMLALLPCGLFLLFEPAWWGPGWYRRRSPAQRTPDLSDPYTAVVTGLARSPARPAAPPAAHSFGDLVTAVRATYVYDPDTLARPHGLTPRGGVTGRLSLHHGGLVFVASEWAERLGAGPGHVVVPMADVTAVRVVPARAGADGVPRPGVAYRSLFRRLVVETGTDSYVFEVGRARRLAARVAQLMTRSA